MSVKAIERETHILLFIVLAWLLLAAGAQATTFYYSVDIGSDLEISDPLVDNDEILDPAHIYMVNVTGVDPEDIKGDHLIFTQGPNPEPGSPVIYPPVGEANPVLYFDIDGEDQLDLLPVEDWPFQGPVEVVPDAPKGLILNPTDLFYSLDDDGPPAWWDGTPDVPVIVPPDYGRVASQDEIFGTSGWLAWPVPGTGVTDENGLNLHENPPGPEFDDDVDALDTRYHRYWFWTCDHEAHFGLDPGSIYITDTQNTPSMSMFIHSSQLGINGEADLDAFEFCATDDRAVVANFTGTTLGATYLAVMFSVDQDDPTTSNVDESGGLSPGVIYISLLDGTFMPLTAIDADVDALALEEGVEVGDAKWVQLPDLSETGVDVCGTLPNLLADDFECTTNQAITRIVIWSSWYKDILPEQGPDSVSFTLSFHSDIPTNQNPNGEYSEPAEPPLWVKTFPAFTYTAEIERAGISEWWFNPFPDLYMNDPFGDTNCWKYTFDIPLEEAFVQTGSVDNAIVYWLDAQMTGDTGGAEWGWKSSLDHWNDDAVWTIGEESNHLQWVELRYDPPHQFAGESLDLAFALYGEDPSPEEDDLDFGDAPDGAAAPMYPTLLPNGARHLIGGPWLGDITDGPDPEADGQPDPNALGDDNDGNDDEDGVSFPVFTIGQTASIQYQVNGSAGASVSVEFWIDWDQNFTWDMTTEYYTASVSDGTHTLTIPTLPSTALTGTTYARVRIATTATGSPSGYAPDGEVEDYEVFVQDEEPPPDDKWLQPPDLSIFGLDVDAMRSNPCLLADDFECTEKTAITNIVVWGSWLEDVLPLDDPNNVIFELSIHSDIGAGAHPNPDITWSMPGETLWLMRFDPGMFNVRIEADQLQEGWYDPTEPDPQVGYIPLGDTICWRYEFPVDILRAFVQTGTVDNPVVYWLDVQAMPLDETGPSFGWKTSADHWNDDACWVEKIEPYNGDWNELRYPLGHEMEGVSIDLAFALSGGTPEQVDEIDYGDAPDSPFYLPAYPTLSANNGAAHIIGGPWLGGAGDAPDAEPDGQESPNADGDNLLLINDENGVSIPTLSVGMSANVSFTASNVGPGAILEVWFDWDGNGVWGDPFESYGPIVVPANGTFAFPVTPPPFTVVGAGFARFRISTGGVGAPTGLATDGEVEDHMYSVTERFDYGDAPRSYLTVKSSDGARHVATGPTLGTARDVDTDGQPSALADGDDLGGIDDEDGVTLPAYIRRAGTETVTISVSAACILNAWVDYNLNGSFDDPAERIFSNAALSVSPTNLTFTVPFGASEGTSYMRFRVSSAGGDTPSGLSADGEVEDYLIEIKEKFPPALGLKWRQPPDCTYGLNLQSWAATDVQGSIYPSPVVADDWWCDGRPINAIRWWGSYIGYGIDPSVIPGVVPTGFRLRWYLDIPAVAGGMHSRPGPMLKESSVSLIVPGVPGIPAANKDEVSEMHVCTTPLDYLGSAFTGLNEFKYEYTVVLSDPWMEKNTFERNHYEPSACSSNVYWISIEAVYSTPPVPGRDYIWGWETTPERFNWNDAAVTATNTIAGTNTPWSAMSYIPDLWPWDVATYHPYTNEQVNMAFAMLSEVVGRRDTKWSQLPNMVLGTDMSSWRYDDPTVPAPPWSHTVLRADDFISDGRRITDIHWWGSYIGWQAATPADEFYPVVAPISIDERPLGFDLSWHLHDPAMGGPGMVLTNIFIPMDRCHEMYYCTIPQASIGSRYAFEHEYQYYVDLLDENLDTIPWPEEAGGHYWLNIQAVFATNFIPSLEWEAGINYPHEGWGWKIAGVEYPDGTSDVQLQPSVVSSNFWPVTIWNVSGLPWWHPSPGLKHDLAFELTTDQPDTNEVINIVSIDVDVASNVYVGSVGTGNAGVQVLQKAGALKPSPITWVDVQTNAAPFPYPAVNSWLRMAAPASNEFYRVIEFTP